MRILTKLDGITEKQKYVTRKDIVTGEKVDDVETFYSMTLVMKKVKLDRDENVKEGTSDPWTRVTISSFDKKVFDEFKDLQMGDEIQIDINPV
jgi:hypothetical protein